MSHVHGQDLVHGPCRTSCQQASDQRSGDEPGGACEATPLMLVTLHLLQRCLNATDPHQ